MTDNAPPAVPADRLRAARKLAGFKSASAAARQFGWGDAAYRHHENGTREIGVAQAIEYGKAFKVTPSWLLALGSTWESAPLPIACFYIKRYADELGEDHKIRRLIDDIYHDIGRVLVPELTVTNDTIEWIDGIDGSPPYHLIDPSYFDIPFEIFNDGYLFAWRAGRRVPRPSINPGDILFVDSSVRDVGTSPELWLMRDGQDAFARWAHIDPDGRIMLLGKVGEASVPMDPDEADILGRVVWRSGRP
jgi:hypothetical protein